MINYLLVTATLRAFEEVFKENEVPYEIDENDAYRGYIEKWEASDEKELYMRQARPAVRRVSLKEPYLFVKDGEPLSIRFNDGNRRMEDSFGELLLERADKDWRIAFSLKNDARIIATTPVADRDSATFNDRTVNVYNEIDDFGSRIFGVPCSNEYFKDMNSILERISAHDRDTWREQLKDDDFAYDALITPMLKAIGAEIPRICKDRPEAPSRMIEFFYGKIDYYYFNPISAVQATKIGCINAHGGLGRIPRNPNHFTPEVGFPTKLLDVRFANGIHGELSKDTVQFSFDGGWAICLTIIREESEENGRSFAINAYLPVTPFGSYRDQTDWEPEA